MLNTCLKDSPHIYQLFRNLNFVYEVRENEVNKIKRKNVQAG